VNGNGKIYLSRVIMTGANVENVNRFRLLTECAPACLLPLSWAENVVEFPTPTVALVRRL
jgi:hypothetical protein